MRSRGEEPEAVAEAMADSSLTGSNSHSPLGIWCTAKVVRRKPAPSRRAAAQRPSTQRMTASAGDDERAGGQGGATRCLVRVQASVQGGVRL